MTARKHMMHGAALAVLALGGLALAAPQAQAQQQSDEQAVAQAEEGNWVLLGGKVHSVDEKSFVLDYGDGQITVEMGSYGWYNAQSLQKGDKVTVSGVMDDDLFDRRTLEASAVYVERMDTYFLASAVDRDEGIYSYPGATFMSDERWVAISGTVGSMEDDEMTLDIGFQSIEVETDDLVGGPDLSEGDRVIVYGEMEDDLFEDAELEAEQVVRLSQG